MLSFFLQLSTPPWKTADELLWCLPALPFWDLCQAGLEHTENTESQISSENIMQWIQSPTKDLWYTEVTEHEVQSR